MSLTGVFCTGLCIPNLSQKESCIITATTQQSRCGSALFFCFCDTGSDLLCYKANQRISPKSSDRMLPGSNISCPLFLECRNFFNIPQQYKGMLCAYQLDYPSNNFKLGGNLMRKYAIQHCSKCIIRWYSLHLVCRTAGQNIQSFD